MLIRMPDGKGYGYRFRNALTGEIVVERVFDSREEMEKALTEDLSPNTALGASYDAMPREGK